MLKKISKILIIRSDDVSDVILTSPAIAAIKKFYPFASISFALKKSNVELMLENPHIKEIIPYDKKKYKGFLGFFRLLMKIHREGYQVVLAPHMNFRLALIIFLTRIPIRIAPITGLWSFLLFNKGIRQHRSEVEMHEAEYNLQLLKNLEIPILGLKFKTELYLRKNMEEKGKVFFQKHGLKNGYKTVIIHPSAAKTVLNYPKEKYIKLGKKISTHYNLLITGYLQEEEIVTSIFEEISKKHHYDARTPTISRYIGKKGLGEFMGVIHQCHALITTNTGPMHIAVALGKKVLTLFSPIQTQSALRWGPYGIPFGTFLGTSPQDKASILVPSVNCTEKFKCALSACIHYPCMPLMLVEDIEEHLHILLKEERVNSDNKEKKYNAL